MACFLFYFGTSRLPGQTGSTGSVLEQSLDDAYTFMLEVVKDNMTLKERLEVFQPHWKVGLSPRITIRMELRTTLEMQLADLLSFGNDTRREDNTPMEDRMDLSED